MSTKASRLGPKRKGGRAASSKGTARPWWWAGLAVAAAVVVVAVSLSVQLGGEAAPGSGELPGPLGGPSVAQDVGTLVGKPAPGFTLSDSDGKSYTVTPGQGRPLVLVFHMGIN